MPPAQMPLPARPPRRPWGAAVLVSAWFLGSPPLPAQALRSAHFADPMLQVSAGLPGCPAPAVPTQTEAEAREETHWRAERGTSCYRSGRCRLPNAYLYDAEIIPRVRQFIQQDGRFEHSSIWVLGQRRWVFVMGCVGSAEQGRALEQAIQNVDDVEAVVGQWMVGVDGPPPYPEAGP